MKLSRVKIEMIIITLLIVIGTVIAIKMGTADGIEMANQLKGATN